MSNNEELQKALSQLTDGTEWEGVEQGDLVEYHGHVCFISHIFKRDANLGNGVWVLLYHGMTTGEPYKVHLLHLMETLLEPPIKHTDDRFPIMASRFFKQASLSRSR